MIRKFDEYQLVVNNIATMEWKVVPFIVIRVEARTMTHIPSIKVLEKTFNIPITNINTPFIISTPLPHNMLYLHSYINEDLKATDPSLSFMIHHRIL